MDPPLDLDARLREKQDFFLRLEHCEGDEEDEEVDSGRASSVRALQGPKVKSSGTSEASADSKGLPRSASDANLSAKAHCRDRGPPLEAVHENRPAALSTRHTFSVASSDGPSAKTAAPISAIPKLPKALGKRKRGSGIEFVSEEQQIFKGQHFYFFPNTDANPARALRIAKALEYGATWQKDFNDSVTHVIVDKAMVCSLLLRFLKRDHLPSNVILVSENYPAECISFRALLDPKNLRFKVKGQEAHTTKQPSADSNSSLKLKAAGGAVKARQPETPSSGKGNASPAVTVSSDEEEVETADAAKAKTIFIEQPTTIAESTDEFEAAIKQARDLQYVPFDQEDEGSERPLSSGGPETDALNSSTTQPQPDKSKNKLGQFQCMQAHTGSSSNPNAATVAILQQMAGYYGQMGDEWRLRAYRKAMATLRNHPIKVRTKEEALALPQIGERLAMKIEEIAVTNRLRRLDNVKAEPRDAVLQTFMNVYGAGFAQANKWVNAGYRSLDDLVKKADLTDNQRVGVEHYADFNSRIPRAEVKQHGDVVAKALHKLDPAFEVIIGGSYRRGAESCGDIDCLITHPTASSSHIRTVVLDRLIPQLYAQTFLVASLALPSRDDGSQWHGASQLGGPDRPWRRIDLLLVPPGELGAAKIYFTGNDVFQRSLRLLASTKGMRLNQRGLYKGVLRGKGRVKLCDGTLVEGRDERRIFEILGVPWREPRERQC